MANVLAQQELDPTFVKALRLLQSRKEDATAQLKAMLDETIAQRRGTKVASDGGKGKGSLNKSGEKTLVEKKKETEKRNLDQLKQDITDLSAPSQTKKSKLDFESHKSSSRTASPPITKNENEWENETQSKVHSKKEQEKEKITEQRKTEKKDKDNIKDDESTESDDDSNMDADDFAFDMGISCIVCRQFDVTSGNQLVECQECHNLYHQECHRPAITEDVNDPRFVWYCSRCAKNLKKMVTAKPHKSKTATQPISKDSNGKNKEPSPIMAFKRMEPIKPSSSKENTSSQGVKAMANWAEFAKLADKTDKSQKTDSKIAKPESKTANKGSVSKSSSSSTAVGVGSKDSAKEKSQIMKKKISSKLQEKRK